MLIHLTGDVGSGKTLLSTLMAMNDDRPIYSNYELNLPNYHELKPESLSKLTESTLVLIDEAYSWLDSRLSGRGINIYLTYILFQSRKRELDILMTDQLIGSIDVRYRAMTNYEIQCRKISDAEQITEENKEGIVGFLYNIIKYEQYYQIPCGKFLLQYEKAKEIFPYYKTKQIINPIDDMMMVNISKDKSDIVYQVNNAVEELLKIYPPSQITKGIVSDFCLNTNRPYNNQYIEMIYNRLKAKILSSKTIKDGD